MSAPPTDPLEQTTPPPVTPPTRPSKTPLTLQGLGKGIAVVVPILVLVVAAVLYLEHRFQRIEERLGKVEGALITTNRGMGKLVEDNTEAHDALIEAVEAIYADQYELAIEVIYCCELSHETAKKVGKKKVRIPKKGGSKVHIPKAPLELLKGTKAKAYEEAAKEAGGRRPEDIFPYALSFDPNPGVTVEKK